ncbi:hypothetical protein AX16_001897 [Volvariella volvacea WC 439]|nr:hypothetical protein AX16_001897 [Volvariella volvacea WC 439]
MNVVREINRINQAELKHGVTGGSWHDEYKDSAYIFVGGLNNELTEGDVITIFSQYGEVMDVNMPRDKETGKPRGFAFLMYEDQRSTILAVDNLNGAKVLERTLRVDHVKNYKQPKIKNDDGEWVDAEEQSLNAKPELIDDGHDNAESDSSESSGPDIDPEDPMRDYLLAKYKEERAQKKSKKSKSKGKSKHKDETPEERRARKERKRERKERKKKKSAAKAVENLLNSIERRMENKDGDESRHDSDRSRSRTPRVERSRSRSRSRSPSRDRYRGSPYRRSRPYSPQPSDSRHRREPQYSGDGRHGRGGPSRGSKRARNYDDD